ncbi:aminoglycoside phosphotransferase family protein [Ornithinimicrobium cryptoxanthini]|uniref:Aminoglycoside phosphotransferase family protein n=1 Tax=Ornithinimicrobium cryptoxanthini TaxID=2934161 RepID=A0ABY4YFJ1_9MICO|nr:aminoglycoside phosphotransferase family protein [Ornithinimicrobium cryptoxanthini]USQ75020.1 aminoglycoside phosphotransferase family protein [Ornithinimicrobium cryptoxanthini]
MSATPEPIQPYGVRISWDDLPQPVRDWVAGELGKVGEVRPQQGGFSPGTADRVRGSRGSAFVKAVGESLNAHTPDLVAREIAVLQQLPAYAGAPVLLSSLDERIAGERWVALMVEDIPGRHPHVPWQGHEVEAALDSLARLAAEPLPETVDLPALEEDMAGDVSLWPEIVADPPEGLDPWVVAHLDRLVELSAAAVPLLRGDRLVHTDIRSDNLLVTGDGAVRVVDWPWACRGSAWVDSLMLLFNVRVHGGPDVAAYAPRLADLGASEEDVDVLLSALLGYFVHAARLPAPPGLPTVRAFQRAQGGAAADWLRERWGDSA